MIGDLSQLIVGIDGADAAPTSQQAAAAEKTLGHTQALLRQWETLKK